MGAGDILVRVAARAGSRAAKARVLANEAKSALNQLREGREMLEGVGIISQSKTAKPSEVGQFFVRTHSGFEQGHNGLRDVASALIDDYNEFVTFFDEAIKTPGLSAEARNVLLAEKEVFLTNIQIIKARQGLPDALYTTDAIAEAIQAGKLSDVSALTKSSLQEIDKAIEAAADAVVALEKAAAVLEQQAARVAAIVGGAGATLVALRPEEVQAAEDLVEDAALRLRVACEVEKEARQREPSFGQKVWANIKEGPDTGMMGLSPDVLDWSGAGAITEAGVAGYHYAKTPNQPKCDDSIPSAVTKAEIARMRANVEAAWKALEQQQAAVNNQPKSISGISP